VIFFSRYHLEKRKPDAVLPYRNRREVAAGVKSECVRKDDRAGKLAKTARKLFAERDGKGAFWRERRFVPGGYLRGGDRQILTLPVTRFAQLRDPESLELPRPRTSGRALISIDWEERWTITWSDYVDALCSVTPSTEVHDRKVRDGRKSNVAAATIVVQRVRKQEKDEWMFCKGSATLRRGVQNLL